jgi:hypothetical protein
LAFTVSGGWLFAERTVLHKANEIDSVYRVVVDTFEQRKNDTITGMNAPDAAQVRSSLASIEAFLGSPEGHAGIWAFSLVCNSMFLVLFAVAGGALGARLVARNRRPEI